MARSSAASASPSQRPSPEPAYETTPITSPRSLRQLSIFVLGAACFVASTAITRRAVHRRQLRIVPKFYEPNTNPHEHFSPFMDAIQALNLATMNCFSVGIMAAGGTLWALDISNLTEMQTALRGRLGYGNLNQPSIPSLVPTEASLEASIRRKREEGNKNDSEALR